MTQVMIYGSCVTRDIFNFEDKANASKVAAYYARSSLASAFHPIPLEDTYSENLDSAFQRRLVCADFRKELSFVMNAMPAHDILIVDFIDERFNLFQFDDGSVCTISSELLTAGFKPEDHPGRVIESHSDEFFELWEQGWARFIDAIRSNDSFPKLYINKVYWSEKTEKGDMFAGFSSGRIAQANQFLDRLYKRVAQDVPADQFFNFDPKLFVGGTAHRWGLSPFHYIDDYYLTALERIRDAQPKIKARLTADAI